jgi:enediyne biosynthesis protein E4
MRFTVVLSALAFSVFLIGWSAAFNAHFTDIAASAGVTGQNVFGGVARKDYIVETTGNGAAIFDYDGDGRNDILITNGTRLAGRAEDKDAHTFLYHNEGDGKFREVSRDAGIALQGWAQGVCIGDYDNDGHPDALIAFYGHNVLMHNKGNGTFEDVTEKAKLPVTGTRYGSGCTFIDYDRDGKLDLFVSNYVDLNLETTPKPGQNGFCEWKGIPVMCGPRGLPLAHNVLYHNNGDGTFTDVTETAGISKPGGRYSLGVVTADFDNDGWPDLYVACDMTPSLLFHNLHNGKFEERGIEAGVAYNYDGSLQAGMGVAVADFDGDGRLDIAKTNFSGDLTSLFHNDDGKFFTDISREAGLGSRQLLGWGIAFVDVDDDGWPDLVIGNGHVYPEVQGQGLGDEYLQPTVLYHNLGNAKFRDVTAEAGPAFQTPRSARGLAVGDLDGSGRQEIVIINMNALPSILKNTTPTGHYLNVVLEPTESNRSGIGGRVTVNAGGRKRIAEVMGGNSFYSQHSSTLHFGLGTTSKVDGVEIRWPNGKTQTVPSVDADETLHVKEQRSGDPRGTYWSVTKP